ncbi:MAG: hypothetical protein MUC99_12725 [Anaerolineae bacterium]|nr:hypothetical protein [Anaerolineae bacterium]
MLISDVRGLSIDVTFDVPNTEYVMRKKERRPGVLAPILEWQDASVAETKPE